MASSSLWRGSSGGAPGGSVGGVAKNQAPRDRHRSLSLIRRRLAHALEHTRGRYATHEHRFSSGCHAGVEGGPGMWTPAAGPHAPPWLHPSGSFRLRDATAVSGMSWTVRTVI